MRALREDEEEGEDQKEGKCMSNLYLTPMQTVRKPAGGSPGR